MNEIVFNDIFKSYDGKIVIKSFSGAFEKNKTTAVIGRSGCGKTTLLRLAAGLEMPDSGNISGIEKHDVSFMFQEPRLFGWMTARENIACVLHKKKKEALRLADDWLDKLMLDSAADGAKYPDQLSGGMKRRVALARALAYDKPIFIFDEPLGELDPKMKRHMARIIKEMTQGKTVFIITHDIEEIRGIADNVFDMSALPAQ